MRNSEGKSEGTGLLLTSEFLSIAIYDEDMRTTSTLPC